MLHISLYFPAVVPKKRRALTALLAKLSRMSLDGHLHFVARGHDEDLAPSSCPDLSKECDGRNNWSIRQARSTTEERAVPSIVAKRVHRVDACGSLCGKTRAEAAGEKTSLIEPSLNRTFVHLRKASVGAGKIAQVLARGWVSPVLTAHPTEVRRKSLLDAEHSIFALLAAREHMHSKNELEQNDAQLRARVSQMWQTELLRQSRLTVRDEMKTR